MARVAVPAVVALAFAVSPALAADAPDFAQAPVVAPQAPAGAPAASTPIYVWSGAYAGAFVGYNAAEFDDAAGSIEGDGVIGGVYAGYNWQTGPFVYGIEGDFGGSDFDLDGGANPDPVSGDTGLFGSLRGRAGVAVDPFMAFVTGGAAARESTLSFDGATDTATSIGYTVGAGVETRITDDVSARLEYRYSDYGDERYDLGGTSVSSGFDEQSVRAGVQVKF